MNQITASAIIPIRLNPFYHTLDRLTDNLIRGLTKIPCKLNLARDLSFPIEISIIPPKKAKKILAGRFTCNLPTHRFRFIELRVRVSFEPKNWIIENRDSVEDTVGLFSSVVTFELLKTFEKLSIASNIACPGSLNSMDGLMFFEGQFGWPLRSELLNSLDILFTDKPSVWPKIKILKLDQVWKWLNNFPDFENGFGSSPLGRALAAFTYLFYSRYGESPLQLLWPIVGLESIYESNGSQRTLKERCELFLKGNQTLIGDLYKRRSALIHGGMNMPFGFGCNDGHANTVDYRNKNLWFIDNSIPIFIATLQKMIQLNIYQLQFELRLKTKKR